MSDKPSSFKIFERMPLANESGGFKIEDKQGLKEQRGVVWEFAKTVGQHLMNGGDMMRTAFPVTLNMPRSYLEVIADGWCYAPLYLTNSAATNDPVERIKLVATFCVAGLHKTITLKKAFNPILGETYQGVFPDGTRIYCEQSSHHPPITSWEVFGPNDCYKMYGYGEWTASFRGNSVKGAQRGVFWVLYPDGTKISFSLPQVNVGGVLWGDRVIDYEGTVTFRDEKNQLSLEFTMPNPHSAGTISSWFGKQKLPSDHLFGELEQDDGKRICRVEGSWLGALEFDGKSYWDFRSSPQPLVHVGVPDPLPSDCRFREDVVLLRQGDAKAAAEAKLRLEERQRRDRALRKDPPGPVALGENASAGLPPPPPPSLLASGKHKRAASAIV